MFPHWLPDVDPITLGKQFGAILCSQIVSSFSPHKSSEKGNGWITTEVLSKYTYCIPKAGQWKSSSTITFKILWSLMDMGRLWYSFATPAINAWWISYLDNRKKKSQTHTDIFSDEVLHLHKCGAAFKHTLNLMLLFVCKMFSLTSTEFKGIWTRRSSFTLHWELRSLIQMAGRR